MIHQQGNPMWFSSVSVAEKCWIHPLKLKIELQRKRDYTDDYIKQMTKVKSHAKR